MAPTDDNKSASKIPRSLILVAASFLVLRILSNNPVIAQTGSSSMTKSWRNLPTSLVAMKAKKAVTPTVQPMAPETEAEVAKLTAACKAEGKLLLYEFAADWSEPARKMEEGALMNGEVSSIVSKHFLPVRIRDVQKEVGQNPCLVSDLQKKYRVFAFPTLVVVDEDGNSVSNLIGNCSSLTIYRFLSRALHSTVHHS